MWLNECNHNQSSRDIVLHWAASYGFLEEKLVNNWSLEQISRLDAIAKEIQDYCPELTKIPLQPSLETHYIDV